MDITLTPAAATHFEKVLARYPTASGIFLGVTESGCAQFSYQLNIADTPEKTSVPEHIALVSQGISLYIPAQFSNILKGTIIDAELVGVNTIIRFNNPNAVSACGCGESFSLQKPSDQ